MEHTAQKTHKLEVEYMQATIAVSLLKPCWPFTLRVISKCHPDDPFSPDVTSDNFHLIKPSSRVAYISPPARLFSVFSSIYFVALNSIGIDGGNIFKAVQSQTSSQNKLHQISAESLVQPMLFCHFGTDKYPELPKLGHVYLQSLFLNNSVGGSVKTLGACRW